MVARSAGAGEVGCGRVVRVSLPALTPAPVPAEETGASTLHHAHSCSRVVMIVIALAHTLLLSSSEQVPPTLWEDKMQKLMIITYRKIIEIQVGERQALWAMQCNAMPTACLSSEFMSEFRSNGAQPP